MRIFETKGNHYIFTHDKSEATRPQIALIFCNDERTSLPNVNSVVMFGALSCSLFCRNLFHPSFQLRSVRQQLGSSAKVQKCRDDSDTCLQLWTTMQLFGLTPSGRANYTHAHHNAQLQQHGSEKSQKSQIPLRTGPRARDFADWRFKYALLMASVSFTNSHPVQSSRLAE